MSHSLSDELCTDYEMHVHMACQYTSKIYLILSVIYQEFITLNTATASNAPIITNCLQ